MIAARGKAYQLMAAADGRIHGELGPRSGYSAGPNYVNGMLICSEGGADSGKAHAWARSWDWDGERVISQQVYDLGSLTKSSPQAVSASCIISGRSKQQGNIIDIATGKAIGRTVRGESPTIAGQYAIIPQQQAGTSYTPRGRADGWATRNFVIVDIADPSQPKLVSNQPVGQQDPARR